MYIGLHVKYPLFLSHFIESLIYYNSDIKFHENPSSGSRTVPCGQRDMTKRTVAFRYFENAPKIDMADREFGAHDIADFRGYKLHGAPFIPKS
jgi:hypothetical protein